MMTKKFIILLPVVLSSVSYQSLYAHDENRDIEKREAERKAAEKQETREDWNDFMSTIKEQEKKANAGSEPGQRNPSRD